MAHEFPTICSCVSNDLFTYSFSKRSFLLLKHINFYFQNTYDRNQLTRLTWYHQNPHFLDGQHTYVTSSNDTSTIEIQDVQHALTTQEAIGL